MGYVPKPDHALGQVSSYERSGELQLKRIEELLPGQFAAAILVDAFESAADLRRRESREVMRGAQGAAEVLAQELFVLLHLPAPLLRGHLPVVVLVERVEELAQLH